MMKFNVVTIFPEMISAALKQGVVGQAITRGEVGLELITPRQFTHDFHQTVDDRPYGGGDGMVMLVEPLEKALASLGANAGRRVLLSAHGEKWSDKKARSWAEARGYVTLICGRYGGVDQRFINQYVDEEISLGDFILSGGELGALVLIDSVVRLLPNVLGNAESKEQESFSDGLLEAPLFTRPQTSGEQSVPRFFLGGDHKKIMVLKKALALAVTLVKRPDLISEIHKNEWQLAKKVLSELTLAELKSCGLSLEALKKLGIMENSSL